MFYGLNKLIKNILPQKLFYRSLIIIITPIILLQVVISAVFFDSLWIKANRGMTQTLVTEIKTIIEIHKNNKDAEAFVNLYRKNFNFTVVYKKNELLPRKKTERWFSPIDRSLRRELKSTFGHTFWFDTTTHKSLVDLRISDGNGSFIIFFPKDRIVQSSARIFALWITIPAIVLILIATIFIRNQTRPIINLATNAEKFGKGEYIKEFRPSGALEIRQATYEFDRMRKRITRHLNQRSEMLSGISHDLRTPLTRLRLQLALIKQKDVVDKMEDDIEEMERMLNEYLDFASTQKKEKTETINLSHLIKNIINQYRKQNIFLSSEENIEVNGRHNSIKRCLVNLIENALSYGKKVEISLKKMMNQIVIYVDDDGSGIPEKEFANVFKPFYRIDKSRSQNRSGVGLGLSIANDIVRSHGGNISLEKSPLNGLRVKIALPI